MGYTPRRANLIAEPQELQELADHFEKSWCLQRETPLLKTKNKGEKQMFEKFKSNSHKIINVEDSLFELIADHEVRVIILPKEYSKPLRENPKFALACGDAVIICEAVDLYDSDVDDNVHIIEFEVKKNGVE